MTTSVTVKTRGRGASVTANGEQIELGPNQERKFDTDDTMSVSIRQQTAEEAEAAAVEEQRVPGSAENDALIQEVPAERLDELSGNTTKPQGNMTGATETAATTDEAAVSDPPARRPGR